MAKSKGQLHVDFLRRVLASGGQIEQANFSLQRGLPTGVEPVYHLTLTQNGVRSLVEFGWTPEIEKFLLFERPQRMESPDEEAERFAAILLNNLTTAAEEVNDEYAVRLVFLDILRARPKSDLETLLSRIPLGLPDFSTAHPNIVDFFTRSIDGLQKSAVAGLGYTNEEATALTTAALRIVLEETFLPS